MMVSNMGKAVLVDFGLSATYSLENDGSHLFVAPELLNKSGKASFGPATDIWALGVTVYYLLTGYYPWKQATSVEQLA